MSNFWSGVESVWGWEGVPAIWRKHMARYYVACTLRELGGLPQALPHPETENSVPFLRVFSSGPFS